jgi:hypothetical protein
MATLADHQKSAFAERLARINAGKQFEHADLVGYQTQAAYKRKFGELPSETLRKQA